MEYPKIETLYIRDEKTHKVTDEIRLPEFLLPKSWLVTEKIDGTNIRVHLHTDGTVIYGGRTDEAQLHASLVTWLGGNLTPSVVSAAFDPGTEAILFGEGYGPKIQKGGGNYRPDVSFRLFDVAVLTASRIWWLNWSNVEDVASKCGISTVPMVGFNMELKAAIGCLGCNSRVARIEKDTSAIQEGIVCRTEPLLFNRRGERVMWKLKGRDF